MIDPLTVQNRRALFALRAATLRDLRSMWVAFDPADSTSWSRFAEPAAALIQARAHQAARLGADYYSTLRAKRLGDRREFLPAEPELPPVEPIAVSLEVTGLAGTYIGVRSGRSLPAAKVAAFTRVAGAAGRHVLNGSRQAIADASTADDRAKGWTRHTTGTCGFCAELAAGGTVNPGAVFAAHDGCGCVAQPVFKPPKPAPGSGSSAGAGRIVGGPYEGPETLSGEQTPDDLMPEAEQRWKSTWRNHAPQGNNSHCSAVAWAMIMTTKPIGLSQPPLKVNDLFKRMQRIDGEPIPHYGSTLAAGAKVLGGMGWLPNGWSQSSDFDTIIAHLADQGPVIVQMPWPLTGPAQYLHAFVLDGIDPATGMIRVHNGWPFPDGKWEAWFAYDVIRSGMNTPDGSAIIPNV